MKKYVILLSAIVLAIISTSCGGGKTETVTVETYPDGKPMIVQERRGDVVVGEKCYYENGKLQYEKHYTNDAKPKGVWQFNYPNGEKFATEDYSKSQTAPEWMIFDRDGSPYYKDKYDSMRVAETGVHETPATIVYYNGPRETELQFYSNGLLRSMGVWVDHLREGVWTFYHPNGNKQTEATFVKGKEEGQYTVFYETGTPLYYGHFKNGLRVGTWEFYDEDGKLIQKKEY